MRWLQNWTLAQFQQSFLRKNYFLEKSYYKSILEKGNQNAWKRFVETQLVIYNSRQFLYPCLRNVPRNTTSECEAAVQNSVIRNLKRWKKRCMYRYQVHQVSHWDSNCIGALRTEWIYGLDLWIYGLNGFISWLGVSDLVSILLECVTNTHTVVYKL